MPADPAPFVGQVARSPAEPAGDGPSPAAHRPAAPIARPASSPDQAGQFAGDHVGLPRPTRDERSRPLAASAGWGRWTARWTGLAVQAGRVTSGLSRRLGLGEGAVIGGRVTLALAPTALARLAADRQVVLVTGTNGKTTTAHLIAAALRTDGVEVAHNEAGANMADGAVTALAARRTAESAVLEVDELHVAAVAGQVRPAVVVLLNLTRDQLDRSTEVTAVAASIRRALEAQPQAVVIANCDDPVVAAVAEGLPRVRWVAAGANWLGDATLCPGCGEVLCGGVVCGEGVQWCCRSCGRRRPAPEWRLGDGELHGPGSTVPLAMGMPGDHNRRNALTAVAAAAALGIPTHRAAAAVGEVRSVGHRFAVVQHGRQRLTLLLAKNPAGWRETLPLAENADGLLLAVNAREADGRDTSWLWDLPLERLPARPTAASGEAAADLALRLAYADVPHRLVPDPAQALRQLPAGEVAVLANYTAFTGLCHRLNQGRHR